VGIIEQGRMLVSGKIEDILARLDPSDQIELELVGDSAVGERVATRLNAREDVATVEVVPGAHEGTTRVIAHLVGRSSPEFQADVVADLVQAGERVSSLRTRREGLEDLFLKVAGKLGSNGDKAFTPETLRAILGDGVRG
jgi:ABC-type multidrug transport system ATPase subunit